MNTYRISIHFETSMETGVKVAEEEVQAVGKWEAFKRIRKKPECQCKDRKGFKYVWVLRIGLGVLRVKEASYDYYNELVEGVETQEVAHANLRYDGVYPIKKV